MALDIKNQATNALKIEQWIENVECGKKQRNR